MRDASSTLTGVKPHGKRAEPLPGRVTHADRIVFPKAGVSKGEVASYYLRVSGLMMPHLVGRPVSLLRAPVNIQENTFLQRHPAEGMEMGLVHVPDPMHSHGDYMAIEGMEGLMTCLQHGTVEFHGWGCTLSRLESPDRLVIDVDPDEDLPFGEVVDCARHLRQLLKTAGLKTFPMLTGGKGIHVVAPLDRTQDWDTVEAFAEKLARSLARSQPERYVATASKAERKGKIYIDWLRNVQGATAIAPWSLRANERAAIACPLSWAGLSRVKSAGAFTLRHHPRKNPWKDFFRIRQSVPEGRAGYF